MKFYDLIQQYDEKGIDKEAWYDSLQIYYHELLDGYKFRQVEYLKIYPLILELQDIDICEKSILQDRINFIINILRGVYDYSYEVYMELEKRNIEDLCYIWNNYKLGGKISEKNAEMVGMFSENLNLNIVNISDIYMKKLLSLLEGLPILDGDEFMYNSLYVSTISEIDIRDEAERLINILKGERPANILIVYKKAVVNYICS